MTVATRTSIVVPTVGRPSLRALLQALADGTARVDCPVIVVDDRRDSAEQLSVADVDLPGLRVIRSGGGGPARARNIGWRNARTEWVSFLDDDVLPDPDWYAALQQDLAAAGAVAGSQGRVRVPLPRDRRPTDWERGTAGLAEAQWITADMSYLRAALAQVGGFDERFPRAYREDADLGLRITEQCGAITTGTRRVTHPVRPSDGWVSVRQQAGNADDFLMRAVHGPAWRSRAGAPRGRRRRHALVTAAGAAALASAVFGRRRTAAVAASVWLAGTGELFWSRTAPGPRDVREVRRMLLTSAVIPGAATWHSIRGAWRHRAASAWQGLPDLVLFDRDGTLVQDVPYNGDPDLVVPMEGAADALQRLRHEGVRIGVVSNQSGVGSGRLTADQVEAVNRRVEELLGPFDVWRWCPHESEAGCGCRKPAPGLVKEACAATAVEPGRCVVVGDIASDVEAAAAAGAHGLLVPTPVTRAEEVANAPRVAPDLPSAVGSILAGQW